MLDFAKGFKTFIANGILLLIAGIKLISPEAEAPTADQAQAVAEHAGEILTHGQAIWVAFISFGNLILRAVTTSPLFNSAALKKMLGKSE